MDPHIKILFAVSASRRLTRKTLEVNICEAYNRKLLPNDKEQDIQTIWQKRVEENPKLYNGTKFRIDSMPQSSTLNVGVTCYRDYLGTNWSPHVKELQELGQSDHGNPQAYMSDPLGVGALVLTSDECVVFLKRSKHCAEAYNLWDVPGGHAEPEELVGKKSFEETKACNMSPGAVVNEIFDSIIREIRDEVNLPVSHLSDPELLGIAQNTTSGNRPSMEFLVRCSRSSQEVLFLYRQGNQAEAEESTNIMLLPLNKVLDMEEKEPEMWKTLAPSAKGCIILYGLSQK
ncbi:uridine diphosphate glucose pyrophosphatase NUDT22-like [Gigantopelta aegis]|uniref:uridine diphosphate glucose pyrophosphatase NUDT22-like n=1 Tax=Gigantopelta aegis TaxID=1735272 RepID=UPI001B88E6F1|nr:uridine diphosphate glucose pyrophosphatase NUDT22-like [Gigantopelta aegis]